MKFLLLLSLALVAAEAAPSITTSKLHGQRRTHQAGELIFADEFDTFDHDVWEHEITMSGGGNWEFQVYWNNRSNSYVRDSTLFIQPTLTADKLGENTVRTGSLDLWGGQPKDLCTMNAFYGCSRSGGGTNLVNPIASARLRTVNSFSFTYGRVEVRAKTPAGDWLWPAIWMLPTNQEYGGWPTSGEIDIMESRGNLQYTADGVNIGAEQVGATVHYGVDYIMNGWPKATFAKNTGPGAPWSDDFHRYQLEWTPDYLRFSIDDVETGTVFVPAGGFWELGEFETSYPGVQNPWRNDALNAPFDKDFFLVMNVACGGVGYFPDNGVNVPFPKPWLNTSPQAAFDFYSAKDQWYPTWQGENAAMQVDYVHVYAL